MPQASYTPDPTSLAGRVTAFFRRNADEELTQAEIATKFDVPRSSVTALLASALSHHWLERRKDFAGATVYVAGPQLAAGLSTPAPAPRPTPVTSLATEAPPQPSKPADKPKPGRAVDVAAVQIDRGIPIPARTVPRKREPKWDPLLARVELGDSFVLPVSTAKSVMYRAQRWGKPRGIRFESRAVDSKNMRIWRTA